MAKYDKLPLLNGSDTSESDTTINYGTRESGADDSDNNVLSASPSHRQPEQEVETRPSSKFVYILTFFSTIGGFLFGYDTGVVSGALILIKDEFALSSVWQELFVSVTIGFAAVFAFLSGPCNEQFGRRPVIITASLVFTVGAVVLGVAYDKWMLLVGRAILGIGIGNILATLWCHVLYPTAVLVVIDHY